jgi:hypothetical protein
MSTKKKSRGRKSSRAHHSTTTTRRKSGKRRRRSRSLSGFGAVANAANQTMKHIQSPLAVAGGLLLGNFAAKGLSKIEALNKEEGVMKFAKPVILTGVGLATAYVGKNNELVRNVGYGVALSGVIMGVQKGMNKQLFTDGLSGHESLETVYVENADEMRRALNAASFMPELPSMDLSGNSNSFSSSVLQPEESAENLL